MSVPVQLGVGLAVFWIEMWVTVSGVCALSGGFGVGVVMAVRNWHSSPKYQAGANDGTLQSRQME